jgi:hypothetical protein
LLDFANDEPLGDGVLYIESQNINSSFSSSGSMDITVPSGVHLTEIRLVGYRPFIGYLSVLSDGALDVYLDEEIIELEEIIVTGEGAQKNIRSSTAGVVSISPREIKDLPVFLGESDVIKAILNLPGVSTLGEGTSGFFIRGGNIDQNLILQDEALFFNSSHALGFFSVFNPDMINNVTLYKGHIPAQYGGRLSSVLEVDLKGNIADDFKLTGGIGTVMSKIAIEAPVIKDKSSLLVGGRFTYSDYLLGLTKNVELQQSSASFYDFNFRYNQKVGKDGILFVSYYQSGDEVQYEEAFGFKWDIRNVALGFNKPISSKLFYELTYSTGNNLNESYNPSPAESFLVTGGQKYMKARQNVFASVTNHEALGWNGRISILKMKSLLGDLMRNKKELIDMEAMNLAYTSMTIGRSPSPSPYPPDSDGQRFWRMIPSKPQMPISETLNPGYLSGWQPDQQVPLKPAITGSTSICIW